MCMQTSLFGMVSFTQVIQRCVYAEEPFRYGELYVVIQRCVYAEKPFPYGELLPLRWDWVCKHMSTTT